MDKPTGTCRTCWMGGTYQIIGERCSNAGCSGIVEKDATHAEYWDVVEGMEHSCPNRREPGVDHWHRNKKNGDLTCSYCGSLSFDQFKELVALCIKSNGAECSIEFSTKKYKVYVTRPGIRNAYEGGIKFYMWHSEDEVNRLKAEDPQAYHILNIVLSWACNVSKIHERKRLARLFPDVYGKDA